MEFLQAGIYDLLNEESFFAHFILNSRVIFDHPQVPTAAATVTNGTPCLIFNTKFMSNKPRKEVAGILKHEVLHLLLDHLTRLKDEIKNNQEIYSKSHLANVAMDCAINQFISGLNEEECITLKKVQDVTGKKLEAFQTAEYYYNALVQYANDKVKDMQTLDEHDVDMPGQETNSQMRDAAIKDAAKKALSSSKGNVSNNLAKILGDFLKDNAAINWKQILRNFVARATSSKTLATRKKTNRRFDFDFPGKKKKRELTLGVCLDSSGSVSDESYKKFLTEVCAISKNVTTVYLVHADCQVNRVDVLKGGKPPTPERHGNGGTAYGPALQECVKRKCDAIVYLGDMDCADIPENPGKPVLWVTVGSTNKPGNFGYMVELK